jgi:hypothetical protein
VELGEPFADDEQTASAHPDLGTHEVSAVKERQGKGLKTPAAVSRSDLAWWTAIEMGDPADPHGRHRPISISAAQGTGGG